MIATIIHKIRRQIYGPESEWKFKNPLRPFTSNQITSGLSHLLKRFRSDLATAAAPEVPPRGAGQLPLAVLAGRRGAFGTYAAVDDAAVALAVAVGQIVLGVGVSGAGARLEKGRRGSVGDALFWVVAYRAGTLVRACVACVEEFW